MQAAEPLGDELVDEPVVLGRRLPAHAAEQADALHRPTAGNTGWTAGGATRTRASTTGAPSGPTMTGLRSSSAIAGWASASAPTRTAMSASASTSASARCSSAQRAQAADHLVRVLAGERGEPHRDVLEHLGGAAARAAGDDRTEALVREHADEHLDARVGHPLDEEVLGAASRRPRAACAISCAARRTAVGPVRPSRTAPGLRLVHDAGRDALQRDRPAELRRGLRRGRDRADPPLLDQRDPVGAEQRLDLVRPQPPAAARERRRRGPRPPRRASTSSSRAGSVTGVARKRPYAAARPSARAAARAPGTSGP